RRGPPAGSGRRHLPRRRVSPARRRARSPAPSRAVRSRDGARRARAPRRRRGWPAHAAGTPGRRGSDRAHRSGIRLALGRRGRDQRAPASLYPGAAGSCLRGGRPGRAVRELLQPRDPAGDGGRGLGPSCLRTRRATAQQPVDAAGVAQRGPVRPDVAGGRVGRRRARVAAGGSEHSLSRGGERLMERTPWRTRYLVFGSPDIRREEYEEVAACLDSRWIGTGPRVARLEDAFRTYIGAPAVAAVNSGSAALQLALKVLGLPSGSEVITSTMTFCATANAIVHAGCVPVLVDCVRETMNLDVEAAARRITPRTRAIVPVHFAGRPCDMPAITALARAHGLVVVE